MTGSGLSLASSLDGFGGPGHCAVATIKVANSVQGRGKPRRLLLIDVENLVGHGRPSREEVLWTRKAFGEMLGTEATDQVVIGCSHCGLLEVGSTWNGARYVIQSGPNGADLALLDVLNENVANRFAGVVIGSGDGIFADAAAILIRQEVKVTVLAPRNALSRRLAMLAHTVLVIQRPTAA